MGYVIERSIVESSEEQAALDGRVEDLVVLKASYGGPTTRSRRDVTALLRSRMMNDGLSIFATNDVMGCDPAPGIVKTLEVTYQQGDVERMEMVPESWELRIGKQTEVTSEADVEEIDIIQAVLSDPEEFDIDEYRPASVETKTSSGGIA